MNTKTEIQKDQQGNGFAELRAFRTEMASYSDQQRAELSTALKQFLGIASNERAYSR